jgi:predicted nucleotidyltransferase
MAKIFIHKINNNFQINDFHISLIDFQKLEPDIHLPQDFNEISCTDNDNDAQYIEYNNTLKGIDDTLRVQLLATERKIDEYKPKLSAITYKKHITTNEIKTFTFWENYDIDIWVDITEEEKAEYQTKIAKAAKEAELEVSYNQIKDSFTLMFNYNNKNYTYKKYKLSALIELNNQKKIVMEDRKKLGKDTDETAQFTAENKFNFHIDGIVIPVTEEQLMKLNIELSEVIDAMYKRKEDILKAIEALNLAQNVIDYQISFDGVETEINFKL